MRRFERVFLLYCFEKVILVFLQQSVPRISLPTFFQAQALLFFQSFFSRWNALATLLVRADMTPLPAAELCAAPALEPRARSDCCDRGKRSIPALLLLLLLLALALVVVEGSHSVLSDLADMLLRERPVRGEDEETGGSGRESRSIASSMLSRWR